MKYIANLDRSMGWPRYIQSAVRRMHISNLGSESHHEGIAFELGPTQDKKGKVGGKTKEGRVF